MAQILDGKVVAAKVQAAVAEGVGALRTRGVHPALAVVLVGEDPASKVYVGGKRRACQAVGIAARDHLFPQGLDEADLLALVRELNLDRSVHGILVQLPLPSGIDEDRVIEAVDPAKDVDGFHPVNARAAAGGPAGGSPVHSGGSHGDPRSLRHRSDRHGGRGGGRAAHRGQAPGALLLVRPRDGDGRATRARGA